MIRKILIANRGEIAIRVMRACREMEIPSVAIYSEADKDALFVRQSGEAYPAGPSPASQSYLNIGKVIEIARRCGADAIHPGYGFLAENPAFASACESEGIKFIGPPGRVLGLTGDKVAARRAMRKAGISVVPGTDECVSDPGEAIAAAREIGYPVILKPSGGGGGIGMTIVADDSELEKELRSTEDIARTTFGIGGVYIEKYLADPRHIEFQILADSLGNVIHLGERECSIQRRHQKLIEESPSPAISPQLRNTIGSLAAHAGKSVGYEGAGTVEFLFADAQFYFLEVNARIQVEHPVTEMVTGIDIVKEQIRIASGSPLSIRQEGVSHNGSAIECRINAEDPLNSFVPTPGKIRFYHPPGGPGVRVDSGFCGSCTVSPFYDPMIAKLIVWGRNREEAILRMRRGLAEYAVTGVRTNIPFHLAVMANERFQRGELGTHFIDQEISLAGSIRDFAEQVGRAQEKLSRVSDQRRKIAAMAVATSLARVPGPEGE